MFSVWTMFREASHDKHIREGAKGHDPAGGEQGAREGAGGGQDVAGHDGRQQTPDITPEILK